MYKKNVGIACLLAAISVALGAFGAHVLEQKLTPKLLHTYHTATQYLFYHSIAIALAALIAEKCNNKYSNLSLKLFMAGICLFSGSLLALIGFKANGIENFNWLGAITPIGGLCFISGWICLAIGALKN